MRNIRLTLAYDGTEYSGWQVQPDRPSVQETVESAIRRLTGESVRVLCAGRTDAGVHAIGQVVNFRTSSSIPPERWRAALQSQLPGDIVVRFSEEVSDDFHATYSAVTKRYRYLIQQTGIDSPFLRRYVWRLGEVLDLPAMQRAALALVGTHDFRCFESHWPNKATSVRTVTAAQFVPLTGWPGWSDQPCEAVGEGEAELLAFEIEADGFLYNMVRAIVGTLAGIGRGRWPAERMAEVIASQDRSQAGETAPPQGLFLVRVNY